jgi:hypothetical protein
MKKTHLLFTILFSFIFSGLMAQQVEQIPGEQFTVQPTKTETTAAIIERAKNFPDVRFIERKEMEYPDRSHLPQNPLANPVVSFPEINGSSPNNQKPGEIQAPQTPSTTFNGVTGPTETGAFPPDDMGAIGPTQYIVFVNGRLRSFNKTTGVADAVLNADPDVFFASVMTPIGGSVINNFTSDPRVRYDRLSGKWILLIIDVPVDALGNPVVANRILIAFSNTSTITGGTIWTFSQFQGDPTDFADYPTLGIDINALYIGTNMFTLPGAFVQTNGYVINRTTLLSGGAYTVTKFAGLAVGAGAGPYTPQGVDNFDITATQGYFIGTDNATFGTLMMRRVSTPGGVPTISANISIAVSTTSFPRSVPHLGNTGGTNGQLDALDDRLFAAMARGGHLWTAHNISVLNTGVAASSGTERRNAVRWYDLTNLTGAPTVTQSGTIFDPALTAANPRWHSIPSVMISGQGHAAFGMTTGGLADRSNTSTTGRLASDALGTTQARVLTTSSSTAYNPPGDNGASNGSRRWGDYSYVSVDPLDDMTMWMINQFCVGTNLYGCQVTKLLAPPPATPASCSPSSVSAGVASVNVTVTGTVVSGSGFYDPGTNLPGPALPFTHISGTVAGVTVNSVTYNSPTSVTLNLNTIGATAGAKNVSITNPDGQALTGTGILTLLPALPLKLISFTGKLNSDKTVTLNWKVEEQQDIQEYIVEKSTDGNVFRALGTVAANNNTSSNYAYNDWQVSTGNNYYRLKIAERSGKTTFSKIVVINLKAGINVMLHPNPVTGILTIQQFGTIKNKTAVLSDGQGKILKQINLNSLEQTVNMETYPAGIYILKLEDGTVFKVVKQ